MKITTLLIGALLYSFLFIFVLSGPLQAAIVVDSSLSVSESYDDNIFFENQNEKDDLVSAVSPALSVTYTGKNLNLSIGYRGRALFYAENADENDFFHTLSIDLDLPFLNRQIRGVEVQVIEEMSFSPELPGFSFIGGGDEKARARAQRLPQGAGQGVQLQKTDTFQNQAGLSLSYDWTERFNTTGEYTNVITRFSDNQFEDREVNLSKFDALYRYPFSLSTTLTNTYDLAVTTGNGGEQVIHTLHFLLGHRMSPTFSATAGIGTAYIKNNKSPEPTFSASLEKLFQRGSLVIQYTNNIASGVGVIRRVTRREALVGNANYGLGEYTQVYVQGSYSSTQSLSDSDGIDEIDVISYTASAGISTQFLSWLTGRLNYSYLRQDARGNANTFGRGGERNLISVQFTASNPRWRIIK